MEWRAETKMSTLKKAIVLDSILAWDVRTPFNFFRTPTTYVVASLVGPTGQKQLQQTTRAATDSEPMWCPSMEFRLDGQDEAGLLLVLELMVQRSTLGDFSVGTASFLISKLRADISPSMYSLLQASDGSTNGRIEIRHRIISCRDAEIPKEADVVLRSISCYFEGALWQRHYLAVSLVDPWGKKLKRLVTPPSRRSEEKRVSLRWRGRMPFSVGIQDLIEVELMLRDEGRGDRSIGSWRGLFCDLRGCSRISCTLRTSGRNFFGLLDFSYEIIGSAPRDPDASSSSSPAALQNCEVESELADLEAKIPDPLLAPDLDGHGDVFQHRHIELNEICCYGYVLSFCRQPMIFFAVSLVDSGGEKLKKLVTPPSPEKGDGALVWRGRMPFSVGSRDLLEFELLLRDGDQDGGDHSIGSWSGLFSDLRSVRVLDRVLWNSSGMINGSLGFSYQVIRTAPRDPDASSSSSPAALENCKLEFELANSAAKIPNPPPLLAPDLVIEDGLTESKKHGAKIPPHQPNPEIHGRQNQSDQSDTAGSAHATETAGKSSPTSSKDPLHLEDEELPWAKGGVEMADGVTSMLWQSFGVIFTAEELAFLEERGEESRLVED